MNKIKYIVLIVGVLSGCVLTKDVSTPAAQYSALYNPSEFSLNAEYRFYHLSDNMTSLYIRLFPGELLFNQANEEAEYRAMVAINYTIYELDEAGAIVAMSDSAGFTLKLGRKDQERSAYFSTRVLLINAGKQYMIRLESRDMQRGILGLKHLYIDKTNVLSAQNFSVVSALTGYPRFLNYISPGEVFSLKYRLPGYDTIFLDFFKPEHETPRPRVTLDAPSYFNIEPDTTIALAYSDTTIFTLPEQGMYHFRLDSVSRAGITLHNFGVDYPQVKSERGLMEPLFYIATETEYRNMERAANLKRAVDDFWLNRSDTRDRSRELIRVYYNRVLYSNLYFTADREGWKTDRGMVFMLFGPPDRMKDSGSEQRWYYISRRQGKVIEFVFERKQGIYSNHDLTWRKNLETMQYWSAAVSSWRSGKVYSLSR
ncbi:MAG: GWxTD domain-containing protein [Bacteroidales bacterium]